MKLLLLSSIFCISILSRAFASKIVVEDKAFVRQATDVYFESEINDLLAKWDVVDCLFGGTEFYLRHKSNKEKIKAYFQIKKYLDEKKFKINDSELNSLVSRLSLKRCKVTDPINNPFIISGIRVEVFLQEIALGSNKSSSKKTLETLQKILDVKYPVFFYD